MHESVDVEWRRLRNLYAAMGDAELAGLAGERTGLTDVAQEALEAVMKERGLVVPERESEAVMASDSRGTALFQDNNGDFGEADAGWMVVWSSPLAVDMRKATAVLESHEFPFRLKSEPLIQGARARTNGMGRLYLSVEEDRRWEAEALLRKETDLFAAEEEVDSAMDDVVVDGDFSSVGLFQEAADVEIAEQSLRGAGIEFKSVKETIEADADTGIPAGEATSVEVKFEEYERAVEVIEQVFAAFSNS